MSENEEVHVVMLPWLAFGHMIPYLDLSIALAKSGIHVSFLSTPRNIQRLPKIPPNLSKFIDFVPFSLPTDVLPENAEASIDVPADKIDCLKIACDLLQEPIKNYIARKLPNWIIVDFFPHWAADIAQDLSIPLITSFVFNASTSVFFGAPEFLAGEGRIQARATPQTLTIRPPWVHFPSNVAYTNHEAIRAHSGFYGVNASGISDSTRIARVVQASRAVALRTCLEFEADYLKLYEEITGKPVIPVGLLPPEKSEKKSIMHEPWSSIFNWLDKQKPRSVIFVGFGSETKLEKEQIHEIAYGVELSGLPFVWALRKPEGVNDDLDAILPPGFCTRTAAQGVVQLGWAPQREILGHPSVGGSFFHAGWGSIIEAMQFGHVLVFLPFIIDQPLNARMMMEEGLGVEVERDENGSFTRNDIANALRKAMLSEQLRARANEAAEGIFRNHDLHWNYIEKFVEYLRNEKS